MTNRLFRPLMTLLRSRVFKYAIGVVVLIAVGKHVVDVWNEISPDQYDLTARPWCYVGSTVTYVLGLACFGWFYGRILDRSGMRIPYGIAQRAYLISHLGKYVPGKAFVVIIRAALSRPGLASPAGAAFATLYETILMMAVGGLVAAIGFAAAPVEPFYVVLAFSLGVGFFVVVSPPVFPRVCLLAKTPFKGVGPESIPRVTWRLVGEGLLSASIGWVLLGASLAWILEGVDAQGFEPSHWPNVVASVAFATVSGFVIAVMPGGLGVREGMLMVTLTPSVGAPLATLSALLLRLTWVVGELAVAALLYTVPRFRPTEPTCSAQ